MTNENFRTAARTETTNLAEVLYSVLLALLMIMGASTDSWSESPLMHNSNRFGTCKDSAGKEIPALNGTSEAVCTAIPGNVWTPTAKWSGSWGLPASQYGELLCGTCHEFGSSNIKNVKKVISPPAGAFPGSSVIFQSTGDFADDTGGHVTSTKVCEVCHSATNYHRYDTTGQSPSLP